MIPSKARPFWQTKRTFAVRILVCLCILGPVPALYGQTDRVSQLINQLKDQDSSKRYLAAKGLGDSNDPRAVEPLIAALKDSDGFVRYCAAGALGDINDPRAVEPLIAALKDSDAFVRSGAAIALGDIKDPRAVEPLNASLTDPAPNVRNDAASALDKIKGVPSPEEKAWIKRQADFDKASSLNTISAYRSFLALFKSDSAETLLAPHPSSKLYWSAREKIEKLIISQINKNGVGQRFRIRDFPPQENSSTYSITVTEGNSPGQVTYKILYPGDTLHFGDVAVGGVSMSPPRGNKSIIRFIGKVPVGDGSIDGDSKDPLSFILLKPYGAVYLDGRGTVVTGGKSVSLPISSASQPKK